MEGTIEIRALRCRGRQGTTADERAREQEYLVDVVVRTDLADAVRSDDLASALDISSLARVVRDAVAERPRALVRRGPLAPAAAQGPDLDGAFHAQT